jgi:transcription termination factor Rho
VSETTETPVKTPTGQSGRGGGGLSGKLLPELKQIAGGLGIKGASSMKKAQLVDAIRSAQSGTAAASQRSGGDPGQRDAGTSDNRTDNRADDRAAPEADRADNRAENRAENRADNGTGADGSARQVGKRVESRVDRDDTGSDTGGDRSARQDTGDRGGQDGQRDERSRVREDQGRRESQNDRSQGDRSQGDRSQGDRSQDRNRNQERNQGGARNQERNQERGQDGSQERNQERNQERGQDGNQERNQERNQDRNQERGQDGSQDRNQDRNQERSRNQNRDDDDLSGNRRRRRRGRERQGGQGAQGGQSSFRDRRQPQDVDLEVTEDDVLVPVAGIVDILDNYAFVRTSGYLPGPEDVYVSLSMARKYGLRKGDAVTGEVRQPRDNDRKEKFNPLINLETINGGDVEAAKRRVDFNKLTPLYASERLRLETDQNNLIGRVIDIAAPIGKGQRGLIVSPSKAGKTMIMQSIANSITTNNPECHLMVVLVDERPEEVTDFQRSVKGEVISSTFDRPASDHTMVAELAIERAKRLVELGHDVVVLLDGITRLGRAYNLAAPASGRILSGGVDSAALYPPKRFFGAARNIEDGGSLTILATALIESGSKMDEVIFEEFKGTGNMEIRLRRDFADKRLFPAIDAVQSGTRREELLMSKEELAIVWKLRRVLSGLDGQQALELLLERLKKTQSNIEFLMQVQKTTPQSNNDD